jgi:hypothetical protein
MATLKLGNTTLAGFSFGGKTEVVTPKKIANIIRAPRVTQQASLAARIIPTYTPSVNSGIGGIGGNGGELTEWLLRDSVWNDNGVWDDTQNWTE